MTADTVRASRDWLGRVHTNPLAWWIPHAAILGALFLPVPVCTLAWIVALAWMGRACILNAARCGPTHCRYTGPYYLAMILPVLTFGLGFVSAGFYGWLALAAVMLLGSKLIWWVTERVWGPFS
jgi:hypothetical protein